MTQTVAVIPDALLSDKRLDLLSVELAQLMADRFVDDGKPLVESVISEAELASALSVGGRFVDLEIVRGCLHELAKAHWISIRTAGWLTVGTGEMEPRQAITLKWRLPNFVEPDTNEPIYWC